MAFGPLGAMYLEVAITSNNFFNSLGVSIPETVCFARSSITVYFPSDEISIERSNPMIPPECTIFIFHSPVAGNGRGAVVDSTAGVLSGAGVMD